MTHYSWRHLWMALMAGLLSLAIVACGSDPAPAPEPTSPPPQPTATQIPATATPVPPTATPPPPTPTAVPMPEGDSMEMGSLENLKITPATTGRDVFGPLSEAEKDCIKGNIGEAFFGLMMNASILQASANPDAAAPIFGCIETDNLILIGVAFMDAQAGGWSEPTRQCVTEVGREHPDSIYLRLGLNYEGPDEGTTDETHDYNLEIYDCMNNAEKKAFDLSLWLGVDRNSTATGADIVGLLSDTELACVMETLSAEEMAAVAVASPLEAVTIASGASHCILPETTIEIFVAGLQWGVGEFSEPSLACVRQFAVDNPAYVGLVQGGIDNLLAVDPDEFVALADTGIALYDCLTPEELEKIQMAFTEAASGGTQ